MTVSVSRLVIAVIWLTLGTVTLRWRDRVRPGRATRWLAILGGFYLVLGLLWLALAFA